MKNTTGIPNKFRQFLTHRYSVRLHMFLILTGLVTAGILSSKLLLAAGVESMLARYPLVILISYGFFFLFVRLWLLYILPSSPRSSSSFSTDMSSIDAGGITLNAGTSTADALPSFSGGGGGFSGGGASGSWGSSSSSGGGSFSLGDIDLDDGAGILIVVIGLVLAAVCGGAIYLVYQAPVILSEVAFNAMLSAGLVRATRNMQSGNWTGSVFRKTWIPFLLILVLVFVFAVFAEVYCPGSVKMSQVINNCMLK